MIKWEEIIKAESADELKEVKLWLFRENMRLQQERKELEEAQEIFLEERINTQKELDQLKHKIVLERKRLKEENLFFDKKMAILTDGFRKLEDDRRKFERDKLLSEERRTSRRRISFDAMEEDIVSILFRNATNPLALKKRYRDLVKIFHPDNLFGDAELMQSINKEFIKKKEEL